MEAKPCPFCGSKNIHVKDGNTFRWAVAYCGDCEAQSGEVRYGGTLGFKQDLAIAEWNTRTPEGKE